MTAPRGTPHEVHYIHRIKYTTYITSSTPNVDKFVKWHQPVDFLLITVCSCSLEYGSRSWAVLWGTLRSGLDRSRPPRRCLPSQPREEPLHQPDGQTRTPEPAIHRRQPFADNPSHTTHHRQPCYQKLSNNSSQPSCHRQPDWRWMEYQN